MAAGADLKIELKGRGIAGLLRIIIYRERKWGLKMADLFVYYAEIEKVLREDYCNLANRVLYSKHQYGQR